MLFRSRNVSADFDAVPLADALDRLLGEQNFALRYGPHDELREIELLGEAASPAPVADAPGVEMSAPGSRKHRRASAGSGPSQSDAPAGAVAGETSTSAAGDAAPGAAVVPLVVGASQAQTSSQSSQSPQDAKDTQDTKDTKADDTPPTADELERKMRRNLLATVEKLDDASLAAFMQSPEGQAVANLIAYYASHHSGSTRQQKAVGIIERLPTPPPSYRPPRRPR